jgi:ABC-2 type transport system permease protein
MTKLLKYELLRRKHMLIGALLSMLFVEGVALFGVFMDGGWNVLAIGMTVLLIAGGLVLVFLDGITRLYSDLKQKQGYMLFMTPQNGYRIIWAKTIFAILEIIAAGLVIIGCLALTGTALNHMHGDLVRTFFARLPFGWNFIFGIGALGLLQLMAQFSIAMLAVTVSRTFMQSSSYNWLIALLMYFALALVVNVADGALLLAFGIVGDVIHITNDTMVLNSGLLAKYFAIGAATYSVWFVVCTFISGRLVNRGIDL